MRTARKGDIPSYEKTVVFVTFESEFAPLGGLSAVMRVLPKRMAQAGYGSCFTIAPYFQQITSRKKINSEIQSTGHRFHLRFGKQVHSIEVLQHSDSAGFQTYLLDSPDFFNAPCDGGDPPSPKSPFNPYLNPDNPAQLLQDALFFCAALPKALIKLGFTKNLILSLQDWETACVAFAVREESAIDAAACVLTLHNSYDHDVSEAEIGKIAKTRLPGSTILTKMIPLMHGPLCTVSDHFAQELLHDPLHTVVYAPNLQVHFNKKGIIGINNGLFGTLDYPEHALDAANNGNFSPLLEEKANRRKTMIQVLTHYQPHQAWGRLDWSNFDGPVFMLFGRDDPRQKGYDLAVAAIQELPPGVAKFVFTPIPGDEGLEGLGFLKALTEQRPGEMKVFPFRMAQGYIELQRGASFLVMCSLYEPFGGATEGYVVGTPVVARATGGLVQQVAPYPSRCSTDEVRRLAAQFHTSQDPPTGFLFRETDMPPDVLESGWRKILTCGYWPLGDRLDDRRGTPLFDAMVKAATQAFLDAIDLYRNRQVDYANMIFQGFQMLDRFSWETAVQKYQNVFDDTLAQRQNTRLPFSASQ